MAGMQRVGVWQQICIDWGVQDRIIQRIQRHSSIAVTMRSYVKAVDADAVFAMTKLGEQFSVPQVFPTVQ